MPDPSGRHARDAVPSHASWDGPADPHAHRYAERARGMRASAIRALFAVASRPEVISLAGGMPTIGGLPLDPLAEMVHDLVARDGTTTMQYASAQGHPHLRELICEVMAEEGLRGDPADVVVTVGSQQAVDLVTRIVCDPGDVVLCEAPSYVGALGVFASYQCDVVHIETDEHGIVPTALATAVHELATVGRRAKLLYTVPTFSNPSGASLSAERRYQVLQVCADTDLLVLEDNPYGLLGFDAEPLPPLAALDPTRVVYAGTFSKTFAPGFRVGWALAPRPIRDRLVLAQEAATLCPPTFGQAVVTRYLERHDWRAQIKDFRRLYADRRDAMAQALLDYLPGTSWTKPEGGFYVWLTLPRGLDASALLPRAVDAGVAYVPGTAFYADGSGAGQLRLSYCYPSSDEIREGVRRLGTVVADATPA